MLPSCNQRRNITYEIGLGMIQVWK